MTDHCTKEGEMMLNGRRIVSLCTSRLNEIENCRFITELNEGLAKKDSTLFIYNVSTDLYWDDSNIRAEASVFSLVDFDVTDVVIIMHEKIKNNTIAENIISEAHRHNVPVIVVDAVYKDCISICFDYKKGFEAVVRHVIEDHHVRRPHFMAGYKDNQFSEERLAVFRKVIEENGIEFSYDMVSYGNFWAKPAKEATEAIVASGNIPEAIICANDIMAINVCSVLRDHGFRVPDDVIVTGFDGIDEINLCIPRMTSSYCGSAGVVPTVLKCINDFFENGITESQCLVEPKVILNESCGCHSEQSDDESEKSFRSFNDRFYRYQDDNTILSAVSESMQCCTDIVECACKMFTDVMMEMSVMVNKDCIDCTKNYYADESHKEFGDDMFVFFESNSESLNQRPFRRRDIVPHIEEYIKYGTPVLFNVISFLNVPLGYICFHMKTYDVVDYCKITAIVNAVGSGIGGFVNMRYQHYLISRIERMYKFDSLTGLYNRLSFNNEFEERKRSIAGETVPITVILSDLDGLKYINDNFGHGAGDNAIKTAAKVLKASCSDDALCVRFGGDEMLALIIGECEPEKIKAEIAKRLKEYNANSDNPYIISASIGIYCTDSSQNTDFELLVKESDTAMYAEKIAKRRRT